MALSLAALLPPIAGRVPYSPSGRKRIGDQRFHSGTTSSGSSKSIKCPSAGRISPKREPTAARTSLAWLDFSVVAISSAIEGSVEGFEPTVQSLEHIQNTRNPQP